jgi:hypothetical protein
MSPVPHLLIQAEKCMSFLLTCICMGWLILTVVNLSIQLTSDLSDEAIGISLPPLPVAGTDLDERLDSDFEGSSTRIHIPKHAHSVSSGD